MSYLFEVRSRGRSMRASRNMRPVSAIGVKPRVGRVVPRPYRKRRPWLFMPSPPVEIDWSSPQSTADASEPYPPPETAADADVDEPFDDGREPGGDELQVGGRHVYARLKWGARPTVTADSPPPAARAEVGIHIVQVEDLPVYVGESAELMRHWQQLIRWQDKTALGSPRVQIWTASIDQLDPNTRRAVTRAIRLVLGQNWPGARKHLSNDSPGSAPSHQASVRIEHLLPGAYAAKLATIGRRLLFYHPHRNLYATPTDGGT